MKRIKLSPFMVDFFLTTFTTLSSSLLLFVMTRLLAQGLGPDGFGTYSLSRKLMATVAPFSTLSMGVAVARYIAMNDDPALRNRYLLSGSILGVLPSLLVLVTGLCLTRPLSRFAFGREGYETVFITTLFLIIGYSLYSVLYAYYRGRGEMIKANILQLVLNSIGPLAVALHYARPGNANLILSFTTTFYGLSAVPLILYIVRPLWANRGQLTHLWKDLKNLFQYGFPRIPSGLALAGILTIGPILAAHFLSLEEVGFLIAAQAVFMISEVGITAFGLIVLPKAAQLYAKGEVDFLKARTSDLIILVVHLGSFVTIQLSIWSNQFVLAWLGPKYQKTGQLTKVFLLALIPYLIYVLLRSIVDAIEERPVNTYNLVLAVLVTAVLSVAFCFAGVGTIGLAIASAMGYLALGFLTLKYFFSRGWIHLKGFQIKSCLALNAVLAVLALMFKVLPLDFNKLPVLIGLVLPLEILLFVIYYFGLRRLKADWVLQLEQRIFKKKIDPALALGVQDAL